MGKWMNKLKALPPAKPRLVHAGAAGSKDEPVSALPTEIEIKSTILEKNSLRSDSRPREGDAKETFVSFGSGFRDRNGNFHKASRGTFVGFGSDFSGGDKKITPVASRPLSWERWEERLAAILHSHLPPVPFKLRHAEYVHDTRRYLRKLFDDLERGPDGPRAKTGALQADIDALEQVKKAHLRLGKE